jgi:hypothetical protein
MTDTAADKIWCEPKQIKNVCIVSLKKRKNSIRIEVERPWDFFTTYTFHLPPLHKLDTRSYFYHSIANELKFLENPLNSRIDIEYDEIGTELKITKLNQIELEQLWRFCKATRVCIWCDIFATLTQQTIGIQLTARIVDPQSARELNLLFANYRHDASILNLEEIAEFYHASLLEDPLKDKIYFQLLSDFYDEWCPADSK